LNNGASFSTVQLTNLTYSAAQNINLAEFDVWPSAASGAGGASPTGDVAAILNYLENVWGA